MVLQISLLTSSNTTPKTSTTFPTKSSESKFVEKDDIFEVNGPCIFSELFDSTPLA